MRDNWCARGALNTFSISPLEEVFPMGLIKVQTSLFTVELPSFTSNPCKLFVPFCLQVYCAIRIFPSLNGLPCCCCRTQNCAHCRSNHPYSPCALTSYMRIIPKGGSSSVSKLCIYPWAEKGKLQTKLWVLSSKMSSKAEVFAIFLDPGAIQLQTQS